MSATKSDKHVFAVSPFMKALTFTSVSKTANKDPQIESRNKMIKAVNEQLVLAAEYLERGDGTLAARTRERKRKNADGELVKTDVAYTPRMWWFKQDGKYYCNIRYGNRPIVFANGKAAVVIGKKSNIVETLTTIRDAVSNKELDELIMSTRKRVKKSKKS